VELAVLGNKKSTYLNKEISALGIRAPSRDRTSDLLITSQLLYQLSYGGKQGYAWCLKKALTSRM
jgi:hypothetical protein